MLKNKNGEYLITKRSPNKIFPDMWETTVGAVIVGENSLKAALREVKEEVGLNLSPTNGQYLHRIKRQYHGLQDFADVWLFNEEVNITEVTCQPEEVCGARWAKPKQIFAMIELGEFMDTFNYLEDLFNEGGFL